MNHQARGVQVSFAVHALLIFGILLFSRSPVRYGKPLVIDFTLVPAVSASGQSRPGAAIEENPAVPRHRAEKMSRPVKERREAPASAPAPAPVPESWTPATTPPALPDETKGAPGAAEVAAAGPPVAGIRESAGGPPGVGGTGSAGSPLGTAHGAAGAESRAAQYLAAHFSYIKELVQKNVSYPAMARKMGWEGKIVIAFTILADGNTRDIRIKESCGIEMLNKRAVEAVKKASPFPRPPVEAQIVLPIVYRLSE